VLYTIVRTLQNYEYTFVCGLYSRSVNDFSDQYNDTGMVEEERIIRTEFLLGSEFLTAVDIKSSVFWDIMPCGPLKVN
jgi:hypothetical protein